MLNGCSILGSHQPGHVPTKVVSNPAPFPGGLLWNSTRWRLNVELKPWRSVVAHWVLADWAGGIVRD